MKKVVFGLICLFVVSQFFVSCSSENDVMSQFSKRKYLKKFKTKDVKFEDEINKYDNELDYIAEADEYASTEEIENSKLDKIEANDDSQMVQLDEVKLTQLSYLKESSKDYTSWNRYNHSRDYSNINSFESNKDQTNIKKRIAGSNDLETVLYILLALILPPLAVVLIEGATTRFWFTLVFWLAGWSILAVNSGGLFFLVAIILGLLSVFTN